MFNTSRKLEEASTHESAKTHAVTRDLMTLIFDLLTPK